MFKLHYVKGPAGTADGSAVWQRLRPGDLPGRHVDDTLAGCCCRRGSGEVRPVHGAARRLSHVPHPRHRDGSGWHTLAYVAAHDEDIWDYGDYDTVLRHSTDGGKHGA